MAPFGRTGHERVTQMKPKALEASSLRWSCPAEIFEFETTEELEPVAGVVGQDSAVEALRFGLECGAPGQNVFVRGLTGTGRMTLVRQLLEELKPECPPRTAYCYVHNFSERDRPRLITLPAAQAKTFKRRVRALAGVHSRRPLRRSRRGALEERAPGHRDRPPGRDRRDHRRVPEGAPGGRARARHGAARSLAMR